MTWTTVLPIALGSLSTIMAAFLAYAGTKARTRQEANQALIVGLQSEVDRLRSDLVERDGQARQNHDELLELRRAIYEAQQSIYSLKADLATWTTGAKVLYRQLVSEGIKPAFVPADFPTTEEVQHEGSTEESPDGSS